jgi:hypothetical protein
MQLANAIREAVRSIDNDQPILNLEPMAQAKSGSQSWVGTAALWKKTARFGINWRAQTIARKRNQSRL